MLLLKFHFMKKMVFASVLLVLMGFLSPTALLSKKERKSAINYLDETRVALLKSIEGLSEPQLNYKPPPDRWSIRECMQHIALAETGLWESLQTTLKEKANPGKRAQIKVSDQEIIKMITNRTVKAQAPEPLKPGNHKFYAVEDALTAFRYQRADIIKFIRATKEDMRNHVVATPIGSIDAYQMVLFIAAHSSRHTEQINEIKKDPGFPKQ